jgi:transposase-like protein
MTDLKDELAWWRTLSNALNKPHIDAKKAYLRNKPHAPIETCPFCQKANIRTEKMNTIGGPDDTLKIGLFKCKSCNQSWSEPIR